MKTTCPRCYRTFPILPEYVGRKGKCPRCGECFVIAEGNEAVIELAEALTPPAAVPPVPYTEAPSSAASAGPDKGAAAPKPANNLSPLGALLVVAAALGVFFFCCGGFGLVGHRNGEPPAAANAPAGRAATAQTQPAATTSGQNVADKPLEYKLAMIDAGGWVADDDLSVARFRSLLSQLDAMYAEDEQQIADMTVKTQELLRNEGVSESLLHIMEGMNLIPLPEQGVQKYPEFTASYLVFRTQGQSHDEAVASLQAVIQALAF